MKSLKLKVKSFWGFTLIELLVVISIIGILAALTLTGFNAARKNARDAQRKSDLQQYRVALEAYASNNNGKYPDTNDCAVLGGDTCTGNSYDNTGIFNSEAVSPIFPEYLPTQIEDPLNTDDAASWGNNYKYWAAGDGITYKLAARLETGGYWVVCSTGKAGKLSTQPSEDTTCDVALP